MPFSLRRPPIYGASNGASAHRSNRARLLAEIEHRAKSAEGKFRHPFFKGLREDFLNRASAMDLKADVALAFFQAAKGQQLTTAKS